MWCSVLQPAVLRCNCKNYGISTCIVSRFYVNFWNQRAVDQRDASHWSRFVFHCISTFSTADGAPIHFWSKKCVSFHSQRWSHKVRYNSIATLVQGVCACIDRESCLCFIFWFFAMARQVKDVYIADWLQNDYLSEFESSESEYI
jgi:hypothetical protein